jgi:predicted transcriptional regulator of viral defense system
MSVDLLKEITQYGLRLFTRNDVMSLPKLQSYSQSYSRILLNVLEKNREIISFGQGIYSLPVELLSGGPIHPFEIAMKLVKNGAISHRSAMAHYHLTDQIISEVYVTVPREKGSNQSRLNRYNFKGVQYNLVRSDKKHYWGVKKVFIGEASIGITDLEKTLIDGLKRPELCGGMREVIFGFENGLDKISPMILLDYAQRSSLVLCKRLGWILETLNAFKAVQDELDFIVSKSYQRLDPMGQRTGTYNRKWMIVENL